MSGRTREVRRIVSRSAAGGCPFTIQVVDTQVIRIRATPKGEILRRPADLVSTPEYGTFAPIDGRDSDVPSNCGWAAMAVAGSRLVQSS